MWRAALFLLLAAALSGCGGGAACPNDLPASCPTPAPTYADVAPIFHAVCNTCHAPDGQVPEKPLTSYAEVFSRRATVLTTVYGCKMPPEGALPLRADQRAALLAWLVCGAPN
jgi:hypothetical protein